jgi:broad specificity phosphatase PhoE
VQLRTWHWVVVSRALWFLGKKGRFESFEAAKSRVDNLVARIEDLSLEHERLVLFGHGMTNYFTRKALMAKGWQLKQKNSDFWGITVLSQ